MKAKEINKKRLIGQIASELFKETNLSKQNLIWLNIMSLISSGGLDNTDIDQIKSHYEALVNKTASLITVQSSYEIDEELYQKIEKLAENQTNAVIFNEVSERFKVTKIFINDSEIIL